jgi:site-specific recombinase XerD
MHLSRCISDNSRAFWTSESEYPPLVCCYAMAAVWTQSRRSRDAVLGQASPRHHVNISETAHPLALNLGMLFSWLTEKGVLAMNPAREVKTERFSRTEGKTPAFVEGEVQKLLDAVEISTHTGLRDRALLGVLAYTFARIGSVVNLKVEDYYPSGKRFLLRFKEKGGKEKELPVHHKLEELLDEYLKATGLGGEPGSVLFPAAFGKTGKLSRRPLARTDAADMLKRRLKQAGLPAHYSPHSFRATGITNFLENDGTLEAAQRIAGHADSRTTKLYDRRGQKVLLEDMERIRY